MDTKKRLFCVLGLVFFLTQVYAASINLKEIEDLLQNKKYSIALEKALNILNTKESMLSPIEAGKLHYLIGVAYKKNENNEMAISYLKKIEQQFPTSEYVKHAFLELADIYKDDYFQREANLEKVFEKFPKTPEAIYAGLELSKGYLNLRNYKKAIPVIEKLVNLWKVAEEMPELYMLLAVAYSGINDYIEAIDYLRIAEKKIPNIIKTNPLYIFEAGKICHNNQNFKKAITYFNKLINVYPAYKDLDEAAIILSQSYERENNLLMSAIYLIKAVEKNPVDKKKKYGLYLNLGRILCNLGEEDLDKVKKNYPLYSDPNKLLTMVKENSPIFEQKRNATILLSGEFKKANNFEQVIDNYYRFLRNKRDPLVEKFFRENLDIYIDKLHRDKNYDEVFKFWVVIKTRKSYLSPANLLKLGKVLSEIGLYRNAEELYHHLERYTMFSKHWPTVRRQLARIYFKEDRFEEYLDTRDRIDLDSSSKREKNEFLYYTLDSYKKLAKEEELKELLEEVTSHEVGNDFQYKILQIKADHLEREKDYTPALNLYEELMTYPKLSDSQRLSLLLKIADLYFITEYWESALAYYDRAEKFLEKQKATDQKEWILFRRISIFKNTERPMEAIRTLRKLKALNPNSFWIQQAEKEN